MPTYDPRIDAYIEEAAEFARPVLRRFRELVHKADPAIEETIKWQMPFFTFQGANVCHMAAFKAHCAVGFWRKEIQADIAKSHAATGEAMGNFGRIARVADLPARTVLIRYVKQSCALIASGAPRSPAGAKKPRPLPPMPPELARALRQDALAKRTFDNFAPSHRREYLEWISEAKRVETREKRVTTAVEWLREGKGRNWQYERRGKVAARL